MAAPRFRVHDPARLVFATALHMGRKTPGAALVAHLVKTDDENGDLADVSRRPTRRLNGHLQVGQDMPGLTRHISFSLKIFLFILGNLPCDEDPLGSFTYGAMGVKPHGLLEASWVNHFPRHDLYLLCLSSPDDAWKPGGQPGE